MLTLCLTLSLCSLRGALSMSQLATSSLNCSSKAFFCCQTLFNCFHVLFVVDQGNCSAPEAFWYGIVCHAMTRYGTVWYSMARHGMAWHGMARGVIWHGVALYGTVRHRVAE